MMFYEDDVISEVRKNREELVREYGGAEAYFRHILEEQKLLEKKGWLFTSPGMSSNSRLNPVEATDDDQ